jgi:chemotaxis methyl-accepting protein methylase
MLWRDYIRHRCGLCFSDSRVWFLRQSLWERMRLCGTQSYREYYHYVTTHAAGEAEWLALLEGLLNHETGFFRHPPSFTALTEHVLPERLGDKATAAPITMWSAGCSTGQEAYSLAMVFLELTAPPTATHGQQTANEKQAEPQARVIGSDISSLALHKARCGLYKSYEMRSLPDTYRQRYFTMAEAGPQAVYQAGPRLRMMVEFGCVNLHDPASSPFAPLPFMGGRGEGVDVIFCQNVLIYFTSEDRLTIVQQLCQRLRPGGCLFLGPAEVVGLRLPSIQSVQLPDVLMYQRT